MMHTIVPKSVNVYSSDRHIVIENDSPSEQLYDIPVLNIRTCIPYILEYSYDIPVSKTS